MKNKEFDEAKEFAEYLFRAKYMSKIFKHGFTDQEFYEHFTDEVIEYVSNNLSKMVNTCYPSVSLDIAKNHIIGYIINYKQYYENNKLNLKTN